MRDGRWARCVGEEGRRAQWVGMCGRVWAGWEEGGSRSWGSGGGGNDRKDRDSMAGAAGGPGAAVARCHRPCCRCWDQGARAASIPDAFLATSARPFLPVFSVQSEPCERQTCLQLPTHPPTCPSLPPSSPLSTHPPAGGARAEAPAVPPAPGGGVPALCARGGGGR